MVVIVVDKTPPSLAGMLTRWLLETKPGVFVGNLNALVRDKLWEKVEKEITTGALMIYSANTEQGFVIEMTGEPQRSVVDLDGVQLIKTLVE